MTEGVVIVLVCVDPEKLMWGRKNVIAVELRKMTLSLPIRNGGAFRLARCDRQTLKSPAIPLSA